jgi:hypothetical protein
MAGILISLLASRTKLSAGVTHSALLSFITGLALVGIRYPLADSDPVKWEAIDHVKISIKLLIVLAILVIAYVNKKKTTLSPMVLSSLGALAISNIIIAYLW